MQNTLKPRFRDPQLVVFAADHGMAVDGIAAPGRTRPCEQRGQLLSGQLPVAVFARIQQIALTVVDCGVAEDIASHERLLMRKIAHGTRNARVGGAMTLDQAHAAMRAGMEIGDTLRGNVLICSGIGVRLAHQRGTGAVAPDRCTGARPAGLGPGHGPGHAGPPDGRRAGRARPGIAT